MAQGLDLRSLSTARSPHMDSKCGEAVKRTRGVGSRRIFSPQFKLQVLDSYRNDVDCRGNQRATARKYNIHRRQIQKWLQCEDHLRTSVEENEKNDTGDSTGPKLRKKVEPEDDKTDLTLNQSATAFARLGGAGRSKETSETRTNLKQEKTFLPEESKMEKQNLKRVAQKLYPSLQNISCVPEEVAQPSADIDGQKYFRDDIACTFGLSPSSTNKRDDNFNKVIRTDDVPLDLKNEVRSEILPEFFPSNIKETSSLEDVPDKLRIGEENNCQSGLTSSGENIDGPKLSVSKSVLKRLPQKYDMGDIDGQELRSRNFDQSKLLCSRSVDVAESSCLSVDDPAPKNSNTIFSSPCYAVKSKFTAEDEDEHEQKLSKTHDLEPSKKPKIETGIHSKTLNNFDHSKSFSPKRKWIKESMQDMLDDADHSQRTSSLPIKQRVKMNLRSLPESSFASEDCIGSNRIASDFSIEKLCSTDSPREMDDPDRYAWHSSYTLSDSLPYPPPLVIPNRIIPHFPDLVSLHFKPDTYNSDGTLIMKQYASDNYSLEVPLKQEKISDTEEMDVDILSITPIENKSFDFSSYNFGKRRSFSVQFKLTVLDAFYNDKDCNKNQRATARKFNINRRQVQKWLSQESDLRSEGSLKNAKYLQRQRLSTEPKQDGCTRCPQHCLPNKEKIDAFDQTIQVKVKHCSNDECLSRTHDFPSEYQKPTLTEGLDFYTKTIFPKDFKTTHYHHNYLYPESNSTQFQDSILACSHLNSSALSVPGLQYLSTWHHNLEFPHGNSKIYYFGLHNGVNIHETDKFRLD